MKKKIRILLLVLLIVTSVFTGVPLGSVVQLQAATKLCDELYSSNMITIKKGGSYTLQMNYNGKTFTSSKFKFKSSDSKVVSVSSKGVLKGKKIGSAKVYVTSKSNAKVKATIRVTVNSTGPQIKQGGTVDTSYGIKFPVVSEFNKIGLDSNNYWTGEGAKSTVFSKTFGAACEAYNKAAHYSRDSPIHDSGAYTLHNGVADDDLGPVTLMRNPGKGCYYFYYTINLSDYDKEGIAINRDLSRALLAMITSTPAEVEAAIFDRIFGAPDSNKKIDKNGAWATIGDCEVKYTRGSSIYAIYEFAIRPAPESVVKKYREKSENWIKAEEVRKKEEAARKKEEEHAKGIWSIDDLEEAELPQNIPDNGTVTIERVNTPDLNTYRIVNPTASTAYVAINKVLFISIPRGKTAYFQGPDQIVEITQLDLPSKKIMKDASPIIEIKDGGMDRYGNPKVKVINHTIDDWSAHAYLTLKDKNGTIVGGTYESFHCEYDENNNLQGFELYLGDIHKGTYSVKQKNAGSESSFSFEAEQRYVRPVDNNRLIGTFHGITLTEEQSYCYLFSVPFSDGSVGDFYFDSEGWHGILYLEWRKQKEVPGYLVKNGTVYEVILDKSNITEVPLEYASLESEIFVSK